MNGAQLLVPLLRSCNSPTNSQLLYELCLCLWQLSYYKPAAEVMAGSGERGRGGGVGERWGVVLQVLALGGGGGGDRRAA